MVSNWQRNEFLQRFALALPNPRVDMPGTKIIPGRSRQFIAPALPRNLPRLHAEPYGAEGVLLSWDRRADLSGLTFELHRSSERGFVPDESTLVVRTTRFDYLDPAAQNGTVYYVLILLSDSGQTEPIRSSTEL